MERSRQSGFSHKPGMPTLCFARVAGTLGICLVAIPLLRPSCPWFRSSPRVPVALPPPRPSTPAAAARRVALRYWARAQRDVNLQREALEAWDPAADADLDPETLRLQLMAADRTGDLHRALQAGAQAESLARTPEDAYEATLLLASLEATAGHPAAELAQARKLVALQPHSWYSLLILRHAEQDNGRGPFTRSPISWRRRHLRLEQAKRHARMNPHGRLSDAGPRRRVQPVLASAKCDNYGGGT